MVLSRMLRLASEFREMRRVSVDLMARAARDNHPFFQAMVRDFYAEVRRRHRRFPLFRRLVQGVAMCELPESFDKYYMSIEGSARRNHKKACREGCSVRPIRFNDHLAAIADIRRSADSRQGRAMPQEYRDGVVAPCRNPESNSPFHDYPYFGVFLGDQLIGYAGCMIAGQVCSIEHILGHAKHLSVGAVPLLMIGIARHLYDRHRQVRYYIYGTYFGAGETMRRFKRKFGFDPHRVDWVLGEAPAGPAADLSHQHVG
jgi:hypothetical protein